jgi:hypothetical protein
MPWNPDLTCQYAEPIIANIVAELIAKTPDALIWAAGTGQPIPPFKVFAVAQTVDVEFPYCYVLADRTGLIYDADAASVDESHNIFIELGNVSSNPIELAHDMLGRARAVQSILFQMSPLSYLAGINNTGGFALGPATHDHGQFARQNQQQRYVAFCQINQSLTYKEQ